MEPAQAGSCMLYRKITVYLCLRGQGKLRQEICLIRKKRKRMQKQRMINEKITETDIGITVVCVGINSRLRDVSERADDSGNA